jgi:hypothetical protein
LDGLVRRSTSALQAGLLAEHALHDVTAASEPLPPKPRVAESVPPPITTAEAARRALALRQAAENVGRPSPAARLARRLCGEAAASTLLPAEPSRPRLAGLPRRPRGP